MKKWTCVTPKVWHAISIPVNVISEFGTGISQMNHICYKKVRTMWLCSRCPVHCRTVGHLHDVLHDVWWQQPWGHTWGQRGWWRGTGRRSTTYSSVHELGNSIFIVVLGRSSDLQRAWLQLSCIKMKEKSSVILSSNDPQIHLLFAPITVNYCFHAQLINHKEG